MNDSALAPLIAIIGADGAGKSTLAADLARELAPKRRAEHVYLGLNSALIAQKIVKLPMVGRLLAPVLKKKADRTRDPQDKILGPVTALVVYWLSLQRKKRFDAMMALRRQGVLVIADRYPQLEAAGFYDGPGLSTARAEGAVVRMLAAREARLYEQMVRHRPTLVLRLNIDADTALARKPDHRRELVEAKIAVTPTLRFGGAKIVDIDATRDYSEERELALRAIEEAVGQA